MKAALALALGFLLASQCPAAQDSTAAGSVAWGTDQCEWRWNGSAWTPLTMCRVFPFRDQGGIWDVYARNDSARRLVYRYKFEAGWVYRYDYRDQSNVAWQQHNPQTVYGLVNNQWLSMQQIAALVRQQQQAQAARTTSPGALSAADQAALARAQADVANANAHANRVWTAPACNGSSNGCR
jgi:hypothetical protein